MNYNILTVPNDPFDFPKLILIVSLDIRPEITCKPQGDVHKVRLHSFVQRSYIHTSSFSL